MLFEIKHRYNCSVLFSLECESFKFCVETAIKSKIDLSSANLSSANLRYANLSSANLSSADLSAANLRYANLRYANLSYANLSSADLSAANLRYANLSSADLSSADLGSANLSSADLRYANLSAANLSSADLIEFRYKREHCFYTFDGALRIGCLIMPLTEWVLGYKEIGEKYHYKEDEIEMYGNFIKMCDEHFKRNNKPRRKDHKKTKQENQGEKSTI